MSVVSNTLPSNYRNNGPSSMPYSKYEPWIEFVEGLPTDELWNNRQWPSQKIRRAPRWASVDLRDGNQSLINPMTVSQKLRYFRCLVKMGYKEIEIGFPSASQIDFDFAQLLIQTETFPDDVWLMVLVQSRDHLIARTVEALKGAKRAIIHLYNSTSELQRRVVFKQSKEQIKELAVSGTRLIRKLSDEILIPNGTKVRFEYSPESFTGTEIQYSLEVCEAVIDTWRPTEEDKIILNLPETVQNAPPNFYADQIEWMHTHLGDRRKVCLISLHPHNDRGTGVASTELAMMAGADRVEGCLFGNGERTGNVCLITLAVNLMHHGIDPEVDMKNLPEIIEMFEACTGMTVSDRHPWAGALVYTAFSGSHQDAIKKGLENMQTTGAIKWNVPYLPIDPLDLGRSYEAIVRINSQSGKGGVSFVLESQFGIRLPRPLQMELSKQVQLWCDKTAKEVSPLAVKDIFERTFMKPDEPLRLVTFSLHRVLAAKQAAAPASDVAAVLIEGLSSSPAPAGPAAAAVSQETTDESCSISPCAESAEAGAGDVGKTLTCNSGTLIGVEAEIQFMKPQGGSPCVGGGCQKIAVNGVGNGPIDAFVKALNSSLFQSSSEAFEVADFIQEAIGSGGSSADALSFVLVRRRDSEVWGAAHHTNTVASSLMAVCSAINRAIDV